MVSELMDKLPKLPSGLRYRLSTVPDTLPQGIPAHAFSGNFDPALPDFLADGPGLYGYIAPKEALQSAIMANAGNRSPAGTPYAWAFEPGRESAVDLARGLLAWRALLPGGMDGVERECERARGEFSASLERVAKGIPQSSWQVDAALGLSLERQAIEGRNDRTRDYLIESGLMNGGTGLLTGAEELAAWSREAAALLPAIPEADRGDALLPFIARGELAEREFGNFREAAQRTCNGLTALATLVKGDCEREFGAETPAASRQMGNGDWLVVHKNEVRAGEDAAKVLKLASDMLEHAGDRAWLTIVNQKGATMRTLGLLTEETNIDALGEHVRMAFPQKHGISQKM